MTTVRVGLIGAGFVTELHATALAQVKNASVVAITSRRGERARELAHRFAIPTVEPAWHALLERSDIDVVTIAVPNDLHAEICIAAAQTGKHVIVEKPLCRTLDEADAMIAACRTHGVKLMYAETLVFTPKYERARMLVQEGALGEVYLVKQLEKHSGPHSPWFWDVDRSGGGVLMDMGCHGLEWFRHVLGKPAVKSVSAQLNTFLHSNRTRGEDHAIIIVTFAGGAVGLNETSWVQQGGMQDRAEIYGSKGVTYADLLLGSSLTTYSETGYGYAVEKAASTSGWSFTMYDELWHYGFAAEMQHFIDCVAADHTPLETGEDGRAVLEMIYAGYESARTGQTVALPFYRKVEKPIDLWYGVAPE
ncbi:MAG: Gfo/Idh/MocA family oxidoreductase [Chloroflexi bacterium]|nr:Gfo/Idh/MocA family oxidoreductase [Chloroflexota bacterium]